LLIAVVAVLAAVVVGAGTGLAQQATWLDHPSEPWNAPGMAIPRAPDFGAFAPAMCLQNERPAARAAALEEGAVLRSGWRLLRAWPAMTRGDTVVVMATAGHDGMCRPTGFNAFVFNAGRFAGTVSPDPMGARTDGTLSRPPALLPDGRVDATYIRYAPTDPLCCPSRPATRVLYRIEMTDAGPVLLTEAPGGGGLRLPASGDGSAQDGSVQDGSVQAEEVGCAATVDASCSTD
jgi:hypothetical protein